jgi:rod shape-determining protein MreC
MFKEKWYGRYLKYFLLAFYNIFAIYLIVNDKNAPETTFRSYINDKIAAVKEGLQYFDSVRELQNENRLLKEENTRLKQEVNRNKEYALQNIRLRRLFQLSQLGDFDYILAEVVGRNPESPVAGLSLNRGRVDSIRTDMVVVSNRGLVGRIIYTGEHTSVVQLLLDKNIRVSCRIQRTRDLAIVASSGKNSLQLLYFPKTNDLRVGDIVVTSGLSSIYPKGIKIGAVEKIEEVKYGLYKKVKIKPAENFLSLEEVFIVRKKRDNEK